jgi:phosphatidylglycerol:prolipoprotein diacylglycerol transferase
MHPILFQFSGLTLYSFGLIVAIAFLVGTLWIAVRARRIGEDANLYLEGMLWFIIAAIAGARLFYIFFFPQEFLADPVRVLFSQGGLVWYGGMAGVSLAVILFTRLKKLSLWRFADVMTPPAAIGLAIGRIGCLMAGCCYGGPCDLPWAIHYPAGHETHPAGVHPAPLYESLALVLVTLMLARVDKHKRFDGETTWFFFILYGIVRFLLEYVRGDRLVWIEALNLSASQVISLAGIALGAGMLFYLSRRRPGSEAASLGEAPVQGPA